MKTKSILLTALTCCALLLACQSGEEMVPDQSNEIISSKLKSQIAMGQHFFTFLQGREEVPMVNSSGSGYARFVLSDDGMSLDYELHVANTEGILFSHIHMAPTGENGPVVAFLLKAQNPPSPLFNGLLAKGSIATEDLLGPLTGMSLEDLISAIREGNTYVNVHTVENGGGELRGQIDPEYPNQNQNYALHLSGDQEEPPVNTKTQGNATFKFNEDLSELHFKINVGNLKDARFAHIHVAPKGINGGVVVTLKADMISGPINGLYAEGVITNEDLSGIMNGGTLTLLKTALDEHQAYVNIHTIANPGGEIRGQF